jgi:glycerophosphoryl diester phosphodiesterase
MNNVFVKIGHRGAMGHQPENTLASFQKALDLKVDAIELDVYKCKTGELVVIHDDRLERTTNGKGYTEEHTLCELKKLDAGNGNVIPTLNEALDLMDNQVLVNIELKGENTAEEVAKVIRNYVNNKNWNSDNFLVSSFDQPELNKFKIDYPEINIGVLLEGIPLDYSKIAVNMNAYSIHLSINFINQKFIDDAQKNKLKVYVYTVNENDDILKMRKMGVDGVFCNFPERLL